MNGYDAWLTRPLKEAERQRERAKTKCRHTCEAASCESCGKSGVQHRRTCPLDESGGLHDIETSRGWLLLCPACELAEEEEECRC